MASPAHVLGSVVLCAQVRRSSRHASIAASTAELPRTPPSKVGAPRPPSSSCPTRSRHEHMPWRHEPPASGRPASDSQASAALEQPPMRLSASVAVAVGSSVVVLVCGDSPLQPKTPPVAAAAKITNTLRRSIMGLSFVGCPRAPQRVRPRRFEYATSVTRQLAVVTQSDSRKSEKSLSREDSSRSPDNLATSVAGSLTAGTSRYL